MVSIVALYCAAGLPTRVGEGIPVPLHPVQSQINLDSVHTSKDSLGIALSLLFFARRQSEKGEEPIDLSSSRGNAC